MSEDRRRGSGSGRGRPGRGTGPGGSGSEGSRRAAGTGAGGQKGTGRGDRTSGSRTRSSPPEKQRDQRPEGQRERPDKQRGGRGSGQSRRRQGEAESAAQEGPRAPGPEIPEEITGLELDSEVKAQLRTLSRPASERVARHLVAAGQFLEEDPERAFAHTEAARADGARLAVVREACGIAAYKAGRYEKTLAELRAARRIGGSPDYLPMMADSERGLGRPTRALELVTSEEAERLDPAGRIELRIVEAGARRDLGEPEAALQALTAPQLASAGPEMATSVARLRYAYADTLEVLGRRAEAAEWFGRAAASDVEGDTDAEERQAALLGQD